MENLRKHPMFDVRAHTNADTHIGKTLNHKYKCILTRSRAAAEVSFLYFSSFFQTVEGVGGWDETCGPLELTVFVILMRRCMIF